MLRLTKSINIRKFHNISKNIGEGKGMLLKNKSFTFQQSNLRILFLILTITGFLFTASAQVPAISHELLAPNPIEYSFDIVRHIEGNTFVAVLTESRMCKSYDGGLTWSFYPEQPWGRAIKELIVITPLRWVGLNIYGELFVTTDGGGTFSRKELASTSWSTMYNSYSLSFGDSLYGIAKFGYQTLFHDIFVTTNSGVNWTGRDLPDSMTQSSVTMLNGGVILATTSTSLYRSSDLGLTWTVINAKFSSDIFQFSPSLALMAASNDTLYKTTDKGLTWAAFAQKSFSRKLSDALKLVDGSIYLYQNPYLSRSTDTCKHFTTIATLPYMSNEDRYFNSLAMSSPEYAVAVGDRGTFSILQGSPLQRTDVSKYHLLSDVSHWADSNIAITGEGESTTDGGKTWRKASFPTRLGRDCFPLLNKNGLAFVAASRYSHQYPNPSTYHIDLVLSQDTGRSWQTRLTLENYKFTDATTLSDSSFVAIADKYSMTPEFRAFIVTFSGNNYSITQKVLTKEITKFVALPEKKALVGTADSSIYISFDTATTWSPIFPDSVSVWFPGNPIKAAPGGWIVAKSEYYGFFESTDYGVTWRKRASPSSPQFSGLGPWTLNSKGVIAIKDDKDVWLWYPDGSKRKIYSYTPFIHPTDLQFVGDFRLYLNTDNKSSHLFIIEDTTTSITPDTTTYPPQTLIPLTTALYYNYPNPFNPTTTIKFDLAKPGFTKGVVYDILGREVSVIVNEDLKVGFYSLDFNANALPSGIYIFRLTSTGYSRTIKMVLCR
jgi:photosystem II stability/assembly factor-like uncharacterized protein